MHYFREEEKANEEFGNRPNTQMNKEELVTPVFSQNELHNDNFTNRTDIVRQNKRASNKYDDNQRGGVDDIKNFSFNPKIYVEDKVALEIFNHGKYN